MDRRLKTFAWIAVAVVALIVGLLIGVASGVADRLFGGPSPNTVATASLESMRAQNRLTVFAARYVAVVTSDQQRFGGLVNAERTLILPGDVRYEVDLSQLREKDVSWNGSTKTLRVQVPEIDVAGPDVDINAIREYGGGGVIGALTNDVHQLDQTNRARAVADLRKQATAAVPMQLARQSARAAIQRSFAMPLQAAGFKDVKVEVRFPTDGIDDPSYINGSTPYEEAIKEAERRRAAEEQK
jgi:hypothetical protein